MAAKEQATPRERRSRPPTGVWSLQTAIERKAVASRAAKARWRKARGEPETEEEEPATVDAESVEEPEAAKDGIPQSLLPGRLRIGDVEAECHVLSNGMRVFTQREMVRLISGGRGSGDLKVYLQRNPLTANNFSVAASVQFRIPGQPNLANGFEATQFIEICDRYLEVIGGWPICATRLPGHSFSG